jgi:coenzyme PQQ precursor peptide PqqA
LARGKRRQVNSYGVDVPARSALFFPGRHKEESMAWTTPVLVEICIGLEINGYMPADGYVPPEF